MTRRRLRTSGWGGGRSAGPEPGDNEINRFDSRLTLRVEADGSLRRVALLTPYRSASGGRAVLATRSPDRASIPLAPDVRLVIRPRALAAFGWPPGTGLPLLHVPTAKERKAFAPPRAAGRTDCPTASPSGGFRTLTKRVRGGISTG